MEEESVVGEKPLGQGKSSQVAYAKQHVSVSSGPQSFSAQKIEKALCLAE
jgi:hypothetical protein